MTLDGKVAIVTGAGSGIGRSAAVRLAALGARVAIVDIDAAAALAVCEEIGDGARALAIAADVRDPASVGDLMLRVHQRFGDLHCLVNNAGVLGGPRFPDAPAQAWMRAVEVNLVGTLNCIQLAMPYLRRSGVGAVVNTASTSGLTPNPLDPVYAATKAAVVNLTRSLAFLATEDSIRVNCVCPALVRTSLERNSAAQYGDEAKRNFLDRRSGRIDGPALEPADVSAQIVRFLTDEQFAGHVCKLVVNEAPQFIAPPSPQKL